MEEIAHGIHENPPGSTPFEGLCELVRPQRQIETPLERVVASAAEAFSDTLCVAMIAAWTDFRASGYGVPSRIGPFDGGIEAHVGYCISIHSASQCPTR